MYLERTLGILFLGSILISGIAFADGTAGELMNGHEIESQYRAGSKIVIVTFPTCHPSERAFQDFSPEIRKDLIENAIFLAPVSESHLQSELDIVRDWNLKNPYQLIPLVRTMPLKFINLDSTPQFYFFREGRVVDKIIGWPKDQSHLKSLREALARFHKNS